MNIKNLFRKVAILIIKVKTRTKARSSRDSSVNPFAKQKIVTDSEGLKLNQWT